MIEINPGPDARFEVRLEPASPVLTLHGEGLPRTDCNSPIHRHGGRLYVFVSHYLPIGHSYRRLGTDGLESLGPRQPVRILDDPDAAAGKWIEAVWRDPAGRLYGWYHAEEVVLCPHRLFLPHIGALVSEDDGLTWRCLGELLRAPAALTDRRYDNGFLVGGYGDFCVVPDRAEQWFHLYFSSYVADERHQGVAVARYPVASRDDPGAALQVWSERGWAPAAGCLPAPILPVRRGWRHADPDAFWGAAVHYNRALDAHVMLLNRTQGGRRDIRQEGIYAAFNRDLHDPQGWSAPIRIYQGGDWYPQAVGLAPHEDDTAGGEVMRFFQAGTSRWQLRFGERRRD